MTDIGVHGFVVVDLDEGAIPQVTLHSSGLGEVTTLNIDVSPCESEVEVFEAVSEQLSEEQIPSIRLIGQPGFPLDVDVLLLHLKKRFGHAKVVDESLYFSSKRIEELSQQNTVVGHVARLGGERIASASDESEKQIADRGLRIALKELGVA
jgi:hypothetical protein